MKLKVKEYQQFIVLKYYNIILIKLYRKILGEKIKEQVVRQIIN